MSRGYKKHPDQNIWGKMGCAHFLNANGQEVKHEYSPRMRAKSKDRGYTAPNLRSYHPRLCHVLMAEIFYGERDVFIDSKGKPYYGHCHHLIEDPLDYRPDNLLCWLSRPEHSQADSRRRYLESKVPNGDLHVFSYDCLRDLQDPRSLPDEKEFLRRVEYLMVMLECGFDPRIYSLTQLHEFYDTDFHDFRETMYHHKNDE